ncbi:hypothetical protein DSCOOX_60730 [Desulfosarcina ovata subsp. ovata]|uniref:Uncharacterized protein n=1 Tax=Desulfosarcina ovata subsp. ovata TaxID=2752305 RepID=A0A5K8AJK6_9BACT|nr:hypothetical protein DSCOOX_60730 [Desulfosarcina ovata subsp. ovata]
MSNTEKREAEEAIEAAKKATEDAENKRWAIDKLWDLYCEKGPPPPTGQTSTL